MAIRLVLADDHPLILNGLKYLFDGEEGFEVVAACKDGDEALDAVRRCKPDILVLDLRMPGKDGMAVAQEIHDLGLSVKVVLLTGELTDKEATLSFRLGIQGILLKEMAPSLLIQCLRKVSSGGQWIERCSFSRAMQLLLQRQEGMEEARQHLTDREMELIRMVAEGFQNKEIAAQLFIAEDTVKRHLYNIYKKLNIKNRPQLIRYAHEKRLI